MEGDSIGGQAGHALTDEFGDGAQRATRKDVDAGADRGHHQVNVVTMLAQHGANGEQDVLHVYGIVLVELVDQLVLGLAQQIPVGALGCAATGGE